MAHIVLEHISYAYSDSARTTLAESPLVLHDINLEIPTGQFLCIIGPSGSGKSTLLRLLLGLSLPREGRITIDGKPVTGPGLDRSFVFQDYSLFPWMKVQENVEFGIEQVNKAFGQGLTKADITARALEYLDYVNMSEAAHKYPYQLSGGMKQRVAIARALAMDTETLLFDEPFGALDVRTRRSLQQLVEDLWCKNTRRKTVVFVTHDITESVLLADRIVFLGKGQILADVNITVPRPRTPELIANNKEAQDLTQELTDLFYSEMEHEDDESFLDQAII